MRKIVFTMFTAVSLAWSQPAAKPADGAFDLFHKALQDTNPEKRKMAAAALGNAGTDSRVIQMLYDALANDKDPAVRQAAAASFGEMKARVAIPTLKAAMDKDPEVGFSAARSLWLMGDKSGKDLIEAVASSTQRKTTSSVDQAKLEASRKLHDREGLEKMGAEEVAEGLLGPFSIGLKLISELRKDPGAQGRLLAITMLTQQCDAESQTAIETAFQNDKNEIVRAGAAKAIGICGDKNVMQQLSDAVISEKYTVQLAAAATVIRLSGAPDSASLKKK